jgi:hypothetical protein
MDRPRTAEALDCVDLHPDVVIRVLDQLKRLLAAGTIRDGTAVNPNTQR